MSENKVLVDNWTLELAASLLQGPDSWGDIRYDNSLRYEIWEHRRLNSKDNDFAQMAQALLHFLDMLVLYDTLVVDSAMMSAWEHFESMRLIRPFVSAVRLGESTKTRIRSSFHDIRIDKETAAISQGALYYWGLANLLGLDYWAAPKRAEFLSERFNGGYKRGFVSVLGSITDEKIRLLVQDLLEDTLLEKLPSPIHFPSFGSTLLFSCHSRTEVLEKAMAFRESRECKAFRNWINEMDYASKEGNLRFIIENMNDMNALVEDLRKELKAQSFYGKAELEIGLSPSLTFDLETINSIFAKFKPKALHISFLRHHFYTMLESSNIWTQLWYLFPELHE